MVCRQKGLCLLFCMVRWYDAAKSKTWLWSSLWPKIYFTERWDTCPNVEQTPAAWCLRVKVQIIISCRSKSIEYNARCLNRGTYFLRLKWRHAAFVTARHVHITASCSLFHFKLMFWVSKTNDAFSWTSYTHIALPDTFTTTRSSRCSAPLSLEECPSVVNI